MMDGVCSYYILNLDVIHYAAANFSGTSQLEVLQLLLEKENPFPLLSSEDNDGNTPLGVAFHFGAETIDYLLSLKAPPPKASSLFHIVLEGFKLKRYENLMDLLQRLHEMGTDHLALDEEGFYFSTNIRLYSISSLL